jgi:putative transposon-encoded protein
MRSIKIENHELEVKDNILGFFEKRIVPHGNGAKVLCPKEFIGKKVYVIIRK